MMTILMENIYADILTIVLGIVVLVYLYFNWAFNYWRRKGVECVSASIPFGSASKVIRRKVTFGEQFKEIYDDVKPKNLRYVGFYLFAKPTLVVLDLSIVKAMLFKDFVHFTDHGNYVNEEQEPLTGHLFALKGQKWRNLRAKLTPTFTSGKMKLMFHTLVECSHGLKELMDDIVVKQKGPVEIKDVVGRYTTDVIGSCAFGLDINSLKNPNSEFRNLGEFIFETSIYESLVRFLALVSPEIVSALRLRFLNKNISDFVMKFVRETIEYREKNNIERNDFMHLLIQLKNNVELSEDEERMGLLKNIDNVQVNGGLTIEQIAAQVLVFFIAGFETSSTTLAFCFYELTTNKDIQEQLRSEVYSVLEEYNNNITYDALSKMTYMDKCIEETLRKYPPLPLLFRECTKNYTIPQSNVTVEKGTRLFIPVLAIHHDPELYPNPETFDPERFSPENKTDRDHCAWLPFGEGPRACIGLRFGIMQIKVALTVLLKDYEFSLNDKTETPLVMKTESIILSAKNGVWLDVKKL